MSGKEESRKAENSLMRMTVALDQTTNALLDKVSVPPYIVLDVNGRPIIQPITVIDPVTGKAFGTTYPFPMGLYNPTSGLNEVPRTPTVYKSVLAVNIGSTAVWTSAVGKKWRLMGMQITLVNGTTAAAGCLLTMLDVATATGLAVQICGAAMGAVGTSSIIFNATFGNGIVAAATNTALNVNLSTALAVAGVYVQVWGTEE